MLRRILIVTNCVGALVLATSSAAKAQVTLGAGAATDYVFRGVSQTDGDPQAYASVDAALGGIAYAGAWVSNADVGDGTTLEYDLYAGFTPQVGFVTLDLGVTYYGYADQPSGAGRDYWEAKVGARAPLGPATFGASLHYAPDFRPPGPSPESGEAWYAELNASSAIPGSSFVVSGALGRRTLPGLPDHTAWNLGLGYPVTDRIGLDLRYWDTDSDIPKALDGDRYAARVTAGVKVSF